MTPAAIRCCRAGLLSAAVTLASALSPGPAGAQPPFVQVPAEQIEALYRAGYDAYQREDCAMAVYWFGGFLAVANWSPARDAAREQLVGQAHGYCVTQLQNALRVKQNLDAYGNITRITAASSGKLDAPPTEHTYAYQPPQLQYAPRAMLPPPR